MKYGVGVQQEPGYCSIEWMQDPTDPYSFTVSEDTDIFTVNQLGMYSVVAWAYHIKPLLEYPTNLSSC
jgi:hypothetical protein